MSPRIGRCLALAAACAALFGPAVARAQAAPAAAPHGHGTPASTAATSPEGVVNINTATEEELERLPGVGPSRASAIVALRQRVQHFRSADDLLRVRGIGHAGMRRLRPYVTLAGPTTLASRPTRMPSPAN